MSASNYSQHWRRTIMPAMGEAPCLPMLPAKPGLTAATALQGLRTAALSRSGAVTSWCPVF